MEKSNSVAMIEYIQVPVTCYTSMCDKEYRWYDIDTIRGKFEKEIEKLEKLNEDEDKRQIEDELVGKSGVSMFAPTPANSSNDVVVDDEIELCCFCEKGEATEFHNGDGYCETCAFNNCKDIMEEMKEKNPTEYERKKANVERIDNIFKKAFNKKLQKTNCEYCGLMEDDCKCGELLIQAFQGAKKEYEDLTK